MMRLHTLTGPMMVPQLYVSPSWMPKTSRKSPTALSTTPGMSNLCWWVLRAGTFRSARMKPTTPTGRLMKKIHCQPSPSTRTPPRMGPTRVAIPAVAPQTDMAAPRRSGGKIRVITAMVWGVMIAAPRPCSTRAAIKVSTFPASPDHEKPDHQGPQGRPGLCYVFHTVIFQAVGRAGPETG